MSLVHNERTKYLATLINTVAAAAIAAGVIAPLVAYSYGVPGAMTQGLTILVSLVWLTTGAILHLAVRLILGRLRA